MTAKVNPRTDVNALNSWLQRDGYISLQHVGGGLRMGEILEGNVLEWSGIVPYQLVVVGHGTEEEYRRQAADCTDDPVIVPGAKFYRVVAE